MLQVDIVTPNRQMLIGATTQMITVPGADGYLEIHPGHSELLTVLKPGVVVLKADGQLREFVVSFGFAEVRQNRVTLLAENCEESHEIDLERARKAQKLAEEKLKGKIDPEEFEKYERKLQRALIRQQAGKS